MYLTSRCLTQPFISVLIENLKKIQCFVSCVCSLTNIDGRLYYQNLQNAQIFIVVTNLHFYKHTVFSNIEPQNCFHLYLNSTDTGYTYAV